MAALQLEQLPIEGRRREAAVIERRLAPELTSGESSSWMANPLRARQACVAAVRALAALRYRTAPLRLLADQTAEALIGVGRAVDGLVLLAGPVQPSRERLIVRLYPEDWLPCLVNSARAFVTIGAVDHLRWPRRSSSRIVGP